MAHITSWHYGNAIALLVSLAPGALSLNTFPDCSSGPLSKLAVCDTSLDVTTRAQSLVNAMTFEEKATTRNTTLLVCRVSVYPRTIGGAKHYTA